MNFGIKDSKRGQIAVYVIIALVLVAGIVGYVIISGLVGVESIDPELAPAFAYYEQCMIEQGVAAADLAGSQAGHVYPGVYIPGSEYAPYSSQLNFLGMPVPYWYYVAGNGIIKEQVPLKRDIEKEIGQYVEENLNEQCNFDDFYSKGIDLTIGSPKVTVTIQDNKILLEVTSELVAVKGNSTSRKTSYNVEFTSKLGKFYDLARNIYDVEKKSAFLENYSIDVMRLYAPVDGVELSCSGKIWKTREVMDDLKSGLEANINAIRVEGDYYALANEEKKYFVTNIGQSVDEAVNFVYSPNWPTKIEITGADGELMKAVPVGNQPGMNMMGFCYADYHFVYDISFPVLVQIYDEQDVFQFPVVVVIEKNVPRNALLTELPLEEPIIEICPYKTQEIEISVYDTRLNLMDANLSYQCFDQTCPLGGTTNGVFKGMAPACVNGYIIAELEGYNTKKQLMSTNEEYSADVIMDREYSINVDLEVGGKPLGAGQSAIVSLIGDKSATAMLPDMPNVKLSEGLYNVSVYVYSNSSIVIPASSKVQCADIPIKGIGGFLGRTQEKCFTVSIPATKIESALVAGGVSEVYILPSDLEKDKITFEVDSMPAPKTLEDLAANFDNFDIMEVNLKL